MKTAVAILLCSLALNARADLSSFNFSVNEAVPDGSSVGVQNTQTISPGGGAINSVQVALHLTPLGNDGGWFGDLYAYLRHADSSGTVSSILLNRVGRTASNTGGLSAGPTVDIMFTETGPDIHLLAGPVGALLTGEFTADARAIDPALAFDTTSRSAGLDGFDGMDADGDWTIFVADVSGGNQYRLDSWGLTLETETLAAPVPETTSLSLLSVVLGSLAFATSKTRRR